MATSPKKSTRERSRSSPSEPRAGASDGRPSLRFHHSEELRAETLELLARLENAEDPTEHAAQLARLVGRLTDSGLDDYFVEPLRLARVGFMVEKSAELGISSAMRVMQPLLRGIVGRMTGEQLLAVCGHIRRRMD